MLGKVVGYKIDRLGRSAGVVEEGGSAPSGIAAYWLPGLTGALSALFTWGVANAVRRPS